MLHGVRILDLTQLLPGPMCTWYLRSQRAQVLKIEPPRGGDPLRHVPPFGPDGVGVWFSALNAGKRSACLDLKTPDGAAALAALIETADVLVEGFRPGVMARLGFDPERLVQQHPRLIIASISGYGQTGPMRHLPGHDLGYRALAGSLAMAARPDGAPSVPGLQVADMAGGALTAAMGISSALFARERTGRGRWLDISMTEGVLAMMGPVVAATATTGRAPEPGQDLLTGGFPGYQMYRCADGKVITFAALEPKFQAAFQRALGAPMPASSTALTALFLTRTRDDWAATLADACAAPLIELDELLGHPLHRARGSITGHRAATRVHAPLATDPDHPHAPAPPIGADTAAFPSPHWEPA